MSLSTGREILHSQARTIVASVIEYFYSEKDNFGPLKNVKKVLERVSDACGPSVSLRTVKRINAQLKAIKSGLNKPEEEENEEPAAEEVGLNTDIPQPSAKKRRITIRTPRKNKHPLRSRPTTDIDDFDKSAIRRHIMNYYERREVPTLRKLHFSLRETGLFHGSLSSVRKIVKGLGFVYKKFNSRKVLMEKPSVALLRCQFLRKTHSIDIEKAVFLDETWLNENISQDKGWTDGTVKGTIGSPLGKGKRLIICHAGSKQGWIKAAPLVFQSKKTSDYHEDMNSEVFENWFFNTLIPAIPKGSSIIMDNAPYHSRIKDKAPTSSSMKADMAKWLTERGISFSQDLRKPELYNVVKLHKPPIPTYVIDSKAASMGYKVIRLPPYHCHYNPIEMVWGHMKGYVKTRNSTFKLKDVEKLFYEAVAAVSPEQWSKYVNHAKTAMDEDWRSEGLNDTSVQEFIINLCPGDFNSDSESESDIEDEDIGCYQL